MSGWSVEEEVEVEVEGDVCSYRCTNEDANEGYIRITKPVNLQRRFE